MKGKYLESVDEFNYLRSKTTAISKIQEEIEQGI